MLHPNMEQVIDNSDEAGVVVVFDKEVEGEEVKEGLKSKELTKRVGRWRSGKRRTSLNAEMYPVTAADKTPPSSPFLKSQSTSNLCDCENQLMDIFDCQIFYITTKPRHHCLVQQAHAG